MSEEIKVCGPDCKLTVNLEDLPTDTGKISDGYHTFDELYFHRMILFATICKLKPEDAWKSRKHEVGGDPMYDGYFIVGINTPEGQFTYHYDLEHWDKFQVDELENAPKFDGHTSNDVTRLLSI